MPDEINPISSLQSVRNRPAMYFGDLNAPAIANCLAHESYCLAIDQIVAKTCSRITTTLSADGFLSVTHNGEPLNTEEDAESGLSEIQSVAEVMYFCAERSASDYVHDEVCRHSMTALNALSGRFELHSYHDGSHYMIAYNRGELSVPLTDLGETHLCGATVKFTPDDQLVQNCEFDLEKLQGWFTSLPIDTSDITVEWNDFRGSIGSSLAN